MNFWLPLNRFQSVIISVFAIVVLSVMTGCAVPLAVHSQEELQHNMGKAVTIEGIYEVSDRGETVRMDHGPTIMLDVMQDYLGFGRAPISVGSLVRASGKVDRGAMLNGYFMEEGMLLYRKGSPEHPVVAEFVLHDAKVEIIAAPGEKPTTKPSK